MKKICKQNSGFTIIEIAIAVTILGLGLSILIGLQSRILSSLLLEEETTKAALYAKYILNVKEAMNEKYEDGSYKENLYSELKKLGYFDGKKQGETRKQLDSWEINYNVFTFEEPPIDSRLQRIIATIRWPKDNNFVVEYIIRTDQGTNQVTNLNPFGGILTQ